MHARDLRLLFLFTEIVRAGSIRGAAAALSLSPPVLSTALRDLETDLGATLLRRTTRSLDLTEVGAAVFSEAEAMCRHAGAALSVMASNRPVSGTLRLSAPVELATSWLPPLLAQYRARFPMVRLSVEATDAPRGAQHGIDISIRATFARDEQAASGLEPAPCAILPIELVSAPSLAGQGTLEARLARSVYISADGLEADISVPVRHPDGRDGDVPVRVTCHADDRLTVRALVIQGFGAARLIRETVQADINAGRLVRLAPGMDFGVVAVRLIPADAQPSPPVLAFLRMMDRD